MRHHSTGFVFLIFALRIFVVSLGKPKVNRHLGLCFTGLDPRMRRPS